SWSSARERRPRSRPRRSRPAGAPRPKESSRPRRGGAEPPPGEWEGRERERSELSGLRAAGAARVLSVGRRTAKREMPESRTRTPAAVFGARGAGMKRHVEGLIRQALSAAVAAGELSAQEPPAFAVEVPGDPRFGDLSTNAALVLARAEGRPPHAIARLLAGHLEAAAPGG